MFLAVVTGKCTKKQGGFPAQKRRLQTVYPDAQSALSQGITVIWIENSLAGRKF
ncbi:hypothetical protein CBFG_03636 [Clostridiales bacterium 1_7_47FAA]|nr:hypothetical protein CBFG_03636 [Clostridiales bacterium 1_7_47FAA]